MSTIPLKLTNIYLWPPTTGYGPNMDMGYEKFGLFHLKVFSGPAYVKVYTISQEEELNIILCNGNTYSILFLLPFRFILGPSP